MIELIGTQIRFRINPPSQFKEFRSKDVGTKGKLSMIIGYDGKGWKVQAYRLTLPDYESVTDVLKDAKTIKNISTNDLEKITMLARKYFKTVN